MQNPKPQTFRSEKYLAFIRTLPCVHGCNQPSEASHINEPGRGMGTKDTDLHAIPHCSFHHNEWHRGTETYKKKYPQINIAKIQVRCLLQYIWQEYSNIDDPDMLLRLIMEHFIEAKKCSSGQES